MNDFKTNFFTTLIIICILSIDYTVIVCPPVTINSLVPLGIRRTARDAVHTNIGISF